MKQSLRINRLISAIKVFLLVIFLITWTSAHTQSRNVSGTVTDSETKETLPGATIQIKGTTSGTTSDINGKYTVQVSGSSAVFRVSFIGYEDKEIVVENQTVINIQLVTKKTMLEQVVVVGYGTQKRSDVTGATVNLKGAELSKQPVLTATQAMQGKVSGVQIISSGSPGSAPQLRIRGTSTLLGGTHVLYVVDGVLTDDITNVNTADIVDMNILKDASSSAIYGSRGANGVVIITTKKGSSTSGKLNITYNASFGSRSASNLVKMANADEY